MKQAGASIVATVGCVPINENGPQVQTANTLGRRSKPYITEGVSKLPPVPGLESESTTQRLDAADPGSNQHSAGAFDPSAFDVPKETALPLKYDRADRNGFAAFGIRNPAGKLFDQVTESGASSTPTETPTQTAAPTETQTASDDSGETGYLMGRDEGSQL